MQQLQSGSLGTSDFAIMQGPSLPELYCMLVL